MDRSNFVHIKWFTAKEFEKSGADISKLQYSSVHDLDRLRTAFERPISIIYNGVTSGNHKSKGHPGGYAFDVYPSGVTNENEALRFMLLATSYGFRKIGIYINSRGVYSFHLETSAKVKLWGGVHVKGGWNSRSVGVVIG